MPLGTTAPIAFDGATNNTSNYLGAYSTTNAADAVFVANDTYLYANSSPAPVAPLYADLTNATSATINQLRLAFATQKFLEIQARGGSRYIEVIKNHFNVTSPDARLQRPEYLGGGSSPVNISPVAQTSSTDATTPQGS